MVGLTQQGIDNFENGGEICPILDSPEPNCFCGDMNSLTIPYVVKYCLRHFRACSVYHRVLREGRPSTVLSGERNAKPFNDGADV